MSARLGLGVGLDLRWGAAVGFRSDTERGEVVTENVVRFLNRHEFSHAFFSFQPRSRNRLRAADYVASYDDLYGRIPQLGARALHQTLFNLGAIEPYDRASVVDFTNELVARYDLSWVNEDLGLWSLHGHPLPYPLPPYLTGAGLRAAVANTEYVVRRLAAPLHVEFPGFSAGTSIVVGTLHAYDVFRHVVEDSGALATIDIGHLLSYQWLRGRRAAALFEDLERLPLAACHEVHLSGCRIAGERFFDMHDGVLLDEQFELLELLLPRLPALRAITFEDPAFDEAGALLPDVARAHARLAAIAARWLAS